MKIQIKKIKYIKELYPRFQLDNYSVNQYRLNIDELPPIIISKNHVLVDGYHRLIAHKLEGRTEIEAEFFDSEDEQEIFIEAIKRNSSHGKQLAMDEKARLAPRLYMMGVSIDEIPHILAVGKSKAYDWTQKLRDNEKDERNAEIIELYLQCHSSRDIEKKLDVSDTTIQRVIQNSISGNLKQPDNLQLYNIWNIRGLSLDQLKYPGQTPREIIENLVYYYSDPPKTNPQIQISKVVDPMAGSGIMGEVCRELIRKYMLFDLDPLREDIPIKKNDILNGFPDEAKNTDLVYFDPPYYNLMDEYPKNQFTESYDSFLCAMTVSLENIGNILNDNGKVALMLKPMNVDLLTGDWLDMTFDCVSIAKELGYKLIKRIGAPLSTQQFRAHDLTRAKEKNVMLNILRDIVILMRV